MKKSLLALSLIALTACGCEPRKGPEESMKKAGNYDVYKLFEYDGCKVYRFYDEGRERYFTNCTETVSSWSEKHGKTTQEYDETIKTSHGDQ